MPLERLQSKTEHFPGHLEMARLCMCSGQSREALENFEKAEKLYRTTLPPSHEILDECKGILIKTRVCSLTFKFLHVVLVFMSGCDRLSSARACELSREGLAILKSTCSPTHPRLSYGTLVIHIFFSSLFL